MLFGLGRAVALYKSSNHNVDYFLLLSILFIYVNRLVTFGRTTEHCYITEDKIHWITLRKCFST